jgi:hypothetical protein
MLLILHLYRPRLRRKSTHLDALLKLHPRIGSHQNFPNEPEHFSVSPDNNSNGASLNDTLGDPQRNWQLSRESPVTFYPQSLNNFLLLGDDV